MKLVKENKYKGNFKISILKKVIALGLASTMFLNFAGCSNPTQDIDDNRIGFLVESSKFDYENGLYSYVINVNGFESEEVDFEDTLRDIRLAKVSEEEEYGTTLLNEMTFPFYKKNLKLLMPDCYDVYSLDRFLRNSKCELKCEVIEECSGGTYVVFYSSAIAKRDMSLNTDFLSVGKKLIHKGDGFASIAIYYNGELVAYKQTGAGSDCQNIIDSTVGDVDLALSTVEEENLLTQTKVISYQDLYNYQETLNEEKKDSFAKVIKKQ